MPPPSTACICRLGSGQNAVRFAPATAWSAGCLWGSKQWRVSVPSRGLYERRRGRINSRGISGESLFVFEGILVFELVVFLFGFSVLPRPECQTAGLASLRASCLTFCATARQVELSRISSRVSTRLWRVSNSGACRFSRSSEIGVPVGWTRVSEDVGSRFLERRRGRMNARGFARKFRLVP